MSPDNINLSKIRDALSDNGDPWEAGVTSLSSLPPEEQRKYLGVVPPPGELSIEAIAKRALQSQAAIRSAAIAAVSAPAAYDLRNVSGKNFVTPIKNQLGCGSCVAFGTVATVESTLRVQRGDANFAVDLSEAHLFFCHARAGGYNCSTGWWPELALNEFKDKGVADEACYPYNLSNTNCSGLCSNWADRLVKITGFQDLSGKPEQIKEWISTKGPVSACFVVYDDFFHYRSGIYRHVTGGQAGGHCVTIVGYNDNPGYWICKNSWGTGWGDQGFFCIAYGECGIDTWRNHGVIAAPTAPYQAFRLHTKTALHPTDQTFEFGVAANRDVFAIKKSGTASGTTEIHVLSAASGYQQFSLHTKTALHPTDQTFEFGVVANGDVFAIKKSGTASGTTEIHVLSAASGYQQFSLHTKTALHPTDQTFEFGVAANRDVFAIKKSGTASGTTEIHVLSAASGYQQFSLHTRTALHPTDQTFEFGVAANDDVFAIKKSGTASGTTEIHVLRG